MCSRPLRPLGFAHLCRSRPRGSILTATHRGFAFYVGFPKRSIPSLATCSLSPIPQFHSPPAAAKTMIACGPLNRFNQRQCTCARDAILIPSAPASVSATLAALPSMSLVPLASLKLTLLPAHSLLPSSLYLLCR